MFFLSYEKINVWSSDDNSLFSAKDQRTSAVKSPDVVSGMFEAGVLYFNMTKMKAKII